MKAQLRHTVGLSTKFAGTTLPWNIKKTNFKPRLRLERNTQIVATSTSRAVDVNLSRDLLKELSYSEQYDILFSQPEINARVSVPKPSPEAQKNLAHSIKIFLSDVFATAKRSFFGRKWDAVDYQNFLFVTGTTIFSLFAPFTFSWGCLALFFVTYFISGCMGITTAYHRLLSHKSFSTPKWMEYVLAYCGVLAVQGHPIEWVSDHRYHHLHTDTPLDPHSPYEGFWWSHLGWLFDHEVAVGRCGDRSNVSDMLDDPFYSWLEKTYGWHVMGQLLFLYLIGGFPALVWGGAFRIAWLHHSTWFVNSAAHLWGYQTYKTGDLSRNNWWVAALAWGEGWHNNHHAFEYSARHGMAPHEFDITWQFIRFLNWVGLADNIKIPSEIQLAKLAVVNQ
eukprot:TRINITY_DN771_c0_g1_i2.p2 TRINITY_DN771_c0_g1~~TRINITY_DN771_c0_g1_i2.p2  ORF type:complete len:392 (+),score=31.64 TRINITY_DN771_c0_g1_i2:155-1330(+)